MYLSVLEKYTSVCFEPWVKFLGQWTFLDTQIELFVCLFVCLEKSPIQVEFQAGYRGGHEDGWAVD